MRPVDRLLARAVQRYTDGAADYGDRTWLRRLSDILGEAMDEAVDGVVYLVIALERAKRLDVLDRHELDAVREHVWCLARDHVSSWERLEQLQAFVAGLEGDRAVMRGVPSLDEGLKAIAELLAAATGEDVPWVRQLGAIVVQTEVRRVRRALPGERQKTLSMAARRLRPAIDGQLVPREVVRQLLGDAGAAVGLSPLEIGRALRGGLGPE